MYPASSARITELLASWCQGNADAREAVMPLVYNDLRRIARRHLWRQRPNHTLQSAALVNEAYLRLIDQKQVDWQNRAHFMGVAAQMMRRILVDHARSHHRVKRGGGAQQVSLDEAMAVSLERADELVELDEALTALAAFDERKSRVVEMTRRRDRS